MFFQISCFYTICSFPLSLYCKSSFKCDVSLMSRGPYEHIFVILSCIRNKGEIWPSKTGLSSTVDVNFLSRFPCCSCRLLQLCIVSRHCLFLTSSSFGASIRLCFVTVAFLGNFIYMYVFVWYYTSCLRLSRSSCVLLIAWTFAPSSDSFNAIARPIPVNKKD